MVVVVELLQESQMWYVSRQFVADNAIKTGMNWFVESNQLPVKSHVLIVLSFILSTKAKSLALHEMY